MPVIVAGIAKATLDDGISDDVIAWKELIMFCIPLVLMQLINLGPDNARELGDQSDDQSVPRLRCLASDFRFLLKYAKIFRECL